MQMFALHNNFVERQIKQYALGRRLWMFCYDKVGAQASANLFSLVMAARANGLEPLNTSLRFDLDGGNGQLLGAAARNHGPALIERMAEAAQSGTELPDAECFLLTRPRRSQQRRQTWFSRNSSARDSAAAKSPARYESGSAVT
jgi:hypothetical protein